MLPLLHTGTYSFRRLIPASTGRLHHRKSTSVTCFAQKTLTGDCIVKMDSKCSSNCKVKHRQQPGSSLQDYMSHAAQNFANIDLPMGGKITSVDAKHIELVIPRIQLFDVWLQPRALAALSTFPERISFTSMTEDCVLNGSHHVKDFKLDERFLIDVTMTFTWKNPSDGPPDLNSNGSNGNSTPRQTQATIEADGRIIVETSFVNRLAEDYAVWADNDDLRQRRLAAEEAPVQA